VLVCVCVRILSVCECFVCICGCFCERDVVFVLCGCLSGVLCVFVSLKLSEHATILRY